MRGGNSIRCEEKQTQAEIANYSQVNGGVPLLAPGAGAHYIMDAWNNGKNASWYSAGEPLSFRRRVSSGAKERRRAREERRDRGGGLNLIHLTLPNRINMLWVYHPKEQQV